MNTTTSINKIKPKKTKTSRLTLLAVLFSIFGSAQLVFAEAPSDDTVVFDQGKKRIHVAECRRYKKEDPSIFEKTTYGKAKAAGKDLCSKCPGSPNAQ